MNPELLPTLILGGILVLLTGWIIWQEVRLRRFLRGQNASSLEDRILTALESAEIIAGHHNELRQHHNELMRRYDICLKGVGMIRFNPYEDTGGNQSFAVALLNSYGDGVIVSSLHGRENTRLFAKPVVGFTCEYQLSNEEQSALDQARNNM